MISTKVRQLGHHCPITILNPLRHANCGSKAQTALV